MAAGEPCKLTLTRLTFIIFPSLCGVLENAEDRS